MAISVSPLLPKRMLVRTLDGQPFPSQYRIVAWMICIAIFFGGLSVLATLHFAHRPVAEITQELASLSDAELESRRASLMVAITKIELEIESRTNLNSNLRHALNQTDTNHSLRAIEQFTLPSLAYPNVLAAAAAVFVVGCFVALSYCCSRDNTEDHIPPFWNLLDRTVMRRDQAQIMDCIKNRLEAESYGDLGCIPLLLNRPWSTQSKVPVLPDRITHNKDWLDEGHKRFPCGVNVETDSMRMTVIGFWMFLWRKTKPYKCMACMIIEGVCDPMSAQVFGLLVGDIHNGGTYEDLVMDITLLLIINVIANRTEYIYEKEVPAASLRYQFTYRLQRHFLGMNGDVAECWPAGRCAAMQLYDIGQAIDKTWKSLFKLVKCCTTLIMCTLIMLHDTQDFPPERLACVIIFASLFVGSYSVTILREKNCIDLALRKRDWQVAWMALARAQVRGKRQGEEMDLDKAAQKVSDCAMVFRRRSLHYYFIHLVASLAATEMSFFAETMVALVAGLSAIRGNIQTKEAAALIGAVRLLARQLKTLVSILLDIIEGYCSVVEISKVFNLEDID